MESPNRKFLLDVIIEEVQFHGYLRSLPTTVWIIIKTDGVRQAVRSDAVWPRQTARLNLQLRLVLDLPCLEGYYFRTSLCTFTPDRSQVKVLASSQIALQSLPNDPCHSFTFPLLKAGDPSTEAVIIGAKTVLREIDLQANAPKTNSPKEPKCDQSLLDFKGHPARLKNRVSIRLLFSRK
jgi:hypothetical protein